MKVIVSLVLSLFASASPAQQPGWTLYYSDAVAVHYIHTPSLRVNVATGELGFMSRMELRTPVTMDGKEVHSFITINVGSCYKKTSQILRDVSIGKDGNIVAENELSKVDKESAYDEDSAHGAVMVPFCKLLTRDSVNV